MKLFKIAGAVAVTQLLTIPHAMAALPTGETGPTVPEMDGSGAIIAIGLVVGLAALFRERFFRK